MPVFGIRARLLIADDLGEPPLDEAAHRVHLEEPVERLRVPDREEHIAVVVGGNVRDAPLVAVNASFAVEALERHDAEVRSERRMSRIIGETRDYTTRDKATTLQPRGIPDFLFSCSSPSNGSLAARPACATGGDSIEEKKKNLNTEKTEKDRRKTQREKQDIFFFLSSIFLCFLCV